MSKVEDTVAILRKNATDAISKLFEANQNVTNCILAGNAPDAKLISELVEASVQANVYGEVTKILDGLEGDPISNPLAEVSFDADQAIRFTPMGVTPNEKFYNDSLRWAWEDVEKLVLKGFKDT